MACLKSNVAHLINRAVLTGPSNSLTVDYFDAKSKLEVIIKDGSEGPNRENFRKNFRPQLGMLLENWNVPYLIRRPRVLREFEYDTATYGHLPPMSRLRKDRNKLTASYDTKIPLSQFKSSVQVYVHGRQFV